MWCAGFQELGALNSCDRGSDICVAIPRVPTRDDDAKRPVSQQPPRTRRMQRMHRMCRVSGGCPEDKDAERIE